MSACELECWCPEVARMRACELECGVWSALLNHWGGAGFWISMESDTVGSVDYLVGFAMLYARLVMLKRELILGSKGRASHRGLLCCRLIGARCVVRGLWCCQALELVVLCVLRCAQEERAARLEVLKKEERRVR